MSSTHNVVFTLFIITRIIVIWPEHKSTHTWYSPVLTLIRYIVYYYNTKNAVKKCAFPSMNIQYYSKKSRTYQSPPLTHLTRTGIGDAPQGPGEEARNTQQQRRHTRKTRQEDRSGQQQHSGSDLLSTLHSYSPASGSISRSMTSSRISSSRVWPALQYFSK